MGSSFKGLPLFDSGPHRFRLLAEGELVVPNTRLNPTQAGSVAVGPLELTIVITGRLVSSTESGLWALRDAVTSVLINPPLAGSLTDAHGRSWLSMAFVRFETEDRTDRGRDFSIGYGATFVRFLGT